MRSSIPETITKGIEYVAAAILAVATLNVFVAGVLRYTLNIGIPDSNDFGKMLLGIMAFYGIGTIAMRSGHIVVTVLADTLPVAAARVMTIAADIVTCSSMGILCWMLLRKAMDAKKENLTSFDLGTPLWGFYVAAAIGLGLGTLVYAWTILTHRHLTTAPLGASPENEGVNL